MNMIFVKYVDGKKTRCKMKIQTMLAVQIRCH
nr:MAG TPA: hypothetical protein [Caudoviricetes sp.]